VRELRQGEPSLVARVQENALLIDLRTVAETEDEEVVRCLM